MTSQSELPFTEWERGWLEGLIDGEGAIGMSKIREPGHGRGFVWRPYVTISNTCFPLMEKLSHVLGGVGVYIAERPGRGNRRTAYGIRVTPGRIRWLLPQLKLVVKEQQRLLVLEALKLVGEHHPRPGVRGASSQNDARLMEIYESLRQLNARGNGGRVSPGVR